MNGLTGWRSRTVRLVWIVSGVYKSTEINIHAILSQQTKHQFVQNNTVVLYRFYMFFYRLHSNSFTLPNLLKTFKTPPT